MEDFLYPALLFGGMFGFLFVSWLVAAAFRPGRTENEIRYPSSDVGGPIVISVLIVALLTGLLTRSFDIGLRPIDEWARAGKFGAFAFLALAAYGLPLTAWRWSWKLSFSDQGASEFRWGKLYEKHAWTEVELAEVKYGARDWRIQLASGRKIEIPSDPRNLEILRRWLSLMGKLVHPPTRMPFWWRGKKR